MALKIKVKQENDPIIWKFLIEPEWKKIKDLEKYLKDIFNLNEIHLMDDDGYLHPKSNINYVRCMSENNEILTITSVIGITPSKDIRPKKRKKLENGDFNSINLNNAIQTKIILEKSDLIYNEILPAVKNLVNKNDEQIQPTENLDDNMNENHVTQYNQNIDDTSENEIQLKKSKKRKRRKKKTSIEEKSELSPVKYFMPEKKSKIKDTNANINTSENKLNPFKKHFHFDDSGEVVIENREANIKFIDNLNDLDSEKPRIIKPVLVHLDNDITNGICHADIQSETDSNKFIENYEESSSRPFIGPQISDEFLNHKLEKWEDFENYSLADDSQRIEKDNPNLCKIDQPKIIIISNEIISNGINIGGNEIII